MKNNNSLVLGFIIATFVIWLLFDAWLGHNGGPTESGMLAYFGQISTSFPWLIGALSGHWFFNRKTVNYKLAYYALIPFVGLIAWDLWWGHAHPGLRVWYRYAGVWFLVGIPCGSYLLPQGDGGAPI